MPKGRYPFRRTLEFLSNGKIILKPNVRTVLLSHTPGDNSKGIRNFIFKDVPQLQYKNPNVQFVTSKNNTKPPRIDIYFDKSESVNIDVENSRASEILTMFQHVAGASERTTINKKHSVTELREVNQVIGWVHPFYNELKEISGKRPKYPARLNNANFGRFGHCFCICEKPGQVPCPSRTALPEANKPKCWQLKSEDKNG